MVELLRLRHRLNAEFGGQDLPTGPVLRCCLARVSEPGKAPDQRRVEALAAGLLHECPTAQADGFTVIAGRRMAADHVPEHFQVEFTQPFPFFRTPVGESLFLEIIATVQVVCLAEPTQRFGIAIL